MLKTAYVLFIAIISTSCSKSTTENNSGLTFSEINSSFVVTDRNNYNCEKIDENVIKHVLLKGVLVNNRDIHDHYSTVGCTVDGTVVVNKVKEKFVFDYGGYIKIGDNTIIGCAKECCKNNFKFCTWEPSGLK